MHLDFEGNEVQVDLKGESSIRSGTGDVVERVRVGLRAKDREEQRRFLETIQKAKKAGINSTDGQGNIVNKWRVLKADWSKLGNGSEYNLVFELEEIK
ncbi:MAG: hypothetical protein ACM3ZC_11960 [Bacteroidota bacterium]